MVLHWWIENVAEILLQIEVNFNWFLPANDTTWNHFILLRAKATTIRRLPISFKYSNWWLRRAQTLRWITWKATKWEWEKRSKRREGEGRSWRLQYLFCTDEQKASHAMTFSRCYVVIRQTLYVQCTRCTRWANTQSNTFRLAENESTNQPPSWFCLNSLSPLVQWIFFAETKEKNDFKYQKRCRAIKFSLSAVDEREKNQFIENVVSNSNFLFFSLSFNFSLRQMASVLRSGENAKNLKCVCVCARARSAKVWVCTVQWVYVYAYPLQIFITLFESASSNFNVLSMFAMRNYYPRLQFSSAANIWKILQYIIGNWNTLPNEQNRPMPNNSYVVNRNICIWISKNLQYFCRCGEHEQWK